MHEKMIARSYLKEMIGAFALYGILLVCTIKFGRPMPEGALRTLVLLTPMLGFFAAIWAIGRHLNRVDEYVRKFMLENIALAAGLTAGVTFTYGFMETAGFPKLSMFVVWCVLCGAFGIASLARAWMNR